MNELSSPQMNVRKSIQWDSKAYTPKHNDHYEYFCLNCEKIITDGRRTRFCSQTCKEEFGKLHPIITWSGFKWRIFERDNFKCRMCGFQDLPKYTEDNKFLLDYPKLECDHIIPLFLSGNDFDPANSQTLCHDCHKMKSRAEAKERTKLRKLIREGKQKTLREVFDETFSIGQKVSGGQQK